MRPPTLAAVAEMALQGDSFDRCLANFLDGFYAEPCAAALVSEPSFLRNFNPNLGRTMDAYLAATAEELAHRYKLPCPDWTGNPERALRRPWFACELASLRAVLILESPAPFRARNLFVSENALTRA